MSSREGSSSGGSLARRASSYMSPPSSASSQEVDNVAEWIKGCMDRGTVSCIELMQRAAEGTSQTISSYYNEDFTAKDPQALAEAIMGEAYKDADSQRGTTRYVLQAFKEGEKTHFARHSFRLPGGLERTDDDTESELPNEKGLVAQMMRHTEAYARMMISGFGETVRGLSAQLQESNRQLNKLAQQQYTFLDMQQQLLDRQADRDLAIRQADGEDKRKAQVFEKLSMLFPILLKKMTGEGKSIEALLGEEQIGSVLEGLSGEQITQILQTLEPVQQGAFMSLYDMYRKRKKKLVDGDKDDKDKGKKDGGDKKDGDKK